MPLQLLPGTAVAFAPRAAPKIVLGTVIEPWLTASLKRSIKVRRPLNSVTQQSKCLADTLGRPNALWTVACLMLPRTLESASQHGSDHEVLHLQAYVVHVDTVSQHEVAFKLTAGTIAELTRYHKETYCVNVATLTEAWPEKDDQLRKLHQDFVVAVNRYVLRTDVRALEGLEEDGAGELLGGRANHVKTAVMKLFLPLEPPAIASKQVPALLQQSQGHYSTSADGLLTSGWVPEHQSLSVASVSVSPEPWHAMPCTPRSSPPDIDIRITDSINYEQDALPSCYDWQKSASLEIDQQALARPSPTPSLSRSIYSQGDQTLYSSPFAAPAVPYTPYGIPTTSHCVTSNTSDLDMINGDFLVDYNMIFAAPYAMSL